jgi:GNAT superfamily N-acetyltransferase
VTEPQQFTEDDLAFVEPEGEEQWEIYYRLRYERLRKPLGLPLSSVTEDPLEPSSIHRLIKVGEQIVAATCWIVGMRREGTRHTPYVRWRQLGVDPAFEGRGVGRVCMREVERYARSIGAAELVGNPRIEHVPWFRRSGWVEVGEGVKLYDQVESLSMVKPLGKAPPA